MFVRSMYLLNRSLGEFQCLNEDGNEPCQDFCTNLSDQKSPSYLEYFNYPAFQRISNRDNTEKN